jgi:hypothetical protein
MTEKMPKRVEIVAIKDKEDEEDSEDEDKRNREDSKRRGGRRVRNGSCKVTTGTRTVTIFDEVAHATVKVVVLENNVMRVIAEDIKISKDGDKLIDNDGGDKREVEEKRIMKAIIKAIVEMKKDR